MVRRPSRDLRRLLGAAFLLGALFALAFWVQASSEEAQVARFLGQLAGRVAALCDERDPAPLQTLVETKFSAALDVQAFDMPKARDGRSALEDWLRLLSKHDCAKLALSEVRVWPGEGGEARTLVKAHATLSWEKDGKHWVDTRKIELGLEKPASGYQITSLSIAPKNREQPEARP